METCGRINALITDYDVVEVIVLGDYNCSSGSRMYDNFRDLMRSNKLVCSDKNILTDAFTYCNRLVMKDVRHGLITYCVQTC